MGPLDSHSRIGESLKASVGLWLNSEEKTRAVRITVSPDLAYHRNTGITEIVNQIEARLERTANGNAFVSMTTKAAVMEPIVALRLKVTINDHAVMRNYAIALNPAPAATRSRTTVSQQRRSKSSVGKLNPIDGSTYIVKSGDSLWRIAHRVNRTNAAQIVEEIFSANPNAFVGGDRNKLKLGSKLILSQLPTATAQQTEPVTPLASTREEISVTENIATEPQPTNTRTESTTPRSREVDWKLRKPLVASELAALEEKYAALRARFSTQSMAPAAAGKITASEIQVTSTLAATKDSNETTNSPSVITTTGVSERLLQSDLPQSTSATGTSNADRNVRNEDIDVASTSGIFDLIAPTASFLYSLFLILAICSIMLLGFIARKELRMLSIRRAEHKFKAREKARRAEVARKAKSRIQNESVAIEVIEPQDDDGVPQAIRKTISLKGGDAKEADIDINIAHGRYNEAEKSLLEVITTAPRNYSAKLRLIEVYYMTERITEFCSLADDLQNNHRVDMADEEWHRVIRMGKIVAPDEVRFSGPRAVENS
ncbi:MAG: Tfp pilus assembly protein FimV [Gammaproteobacteria bacterium]|jgi:Tfp pilus assembly protein FimV